MYTSHSSINPAKPRLVQMVVALFLVLFLFSACSPSQSTMAPGSTQLPGDSGGLVTKDKAPFAVAAKMALAEKLGVSADQVTFVSADLTEWPDKCLGVTVMGQMCAQGITPGYLVKLKVNDVTYEVHTDELGGSVRIKE